MALYFDLRINSNVLGRVEVRRQERVDISDPEAIADEIFTYTVTRDGRPMGTVVHRYGRGAWALLAEVADLLAELDGEREVGERMGVVRTRYTVPDAGGDR